MDPVHGSSGFPGFSAECRQHKLSVVLCSFVVIPLTGTVASLNKRTKLRPAVRFSDLTHHAQHVGVFLGRHVKILLFKEPILLSGGSVGRAVSSQLQGHRFESQSSCFCVYALHLFKKVDGWSLAEWRAVMLLLLCD